MHGLAHRVVKLREGEPPQVLGAAEQTTVTGIKLVKFNLTFQTVN